MRDYVEMLYRRHVEEFTRCADFVALEQGRGERADYDRFIANVFETHQTSPHFLGFLFSVAPPGSVERVKHNLLEELGLDQEGGESHPALLARLIRGAGLADRIDELRQRARRRLAEQVAEPLLYGSLREVGLAAFVQIVAFEYMLCRVSSRIARFLRVHGGIAEERLIWFAWNRFRPTHTDLESCRLLPTDREDSCLHVPYRVPSRHPAHRDPRPFVPRRRYVGFELVLGYCVSVHAFRG